MLDVDEGVKLPLELLVLALDVPYEEDEESAVEKMTAEVSDVEDEESEVKMLLVEASDEEDEESDVGKLMPEVVLLREINRGAEAGVLPSPLVELKLDEPVDVFDSAFAFVEVVVLEDVVEL